MSTQILSIPTVQTLNSFNAKNIVNIITRLLAETITLYYSNHGYNENLVGCDNAIKVDTEHLNPSITYNRHERIFKITHRDMPFGKIELEQRIGSVMVYLDLYGDWPIPDYKSPDFFDSLEIAVFKEFVTN